MRTNCGGLAMMPRIVRQAWAAVSPRTEWGGRGRLMERVIGGGRAATVTVRYIIDAALLAKDRAPDEDRWLVGGRDFWNGRNNSAGRYKGQKGRSRWPHR